MAAAASVSAGAGRLAACADTPRAPSAISIAAPTANAEDTARCLVEPPKVLMLHNPIFVAQLVEMRSHRLGGGLVQELGHVGVDAFDDLGHFERTVAQGAEDLLFAQFAMGDVLANLFLLIVDDGAVRRIDLFDIECEQAAQ